MTRRSWLLFAAMCVISGIPYLLIKVAVRDLSPGTLLFLRTAGGAFVLLPLALRRGGFGPVLRRWRPLLAFAAVEMAGPWLLLSDAERHLSSSLTGLLIAAVPLIVAVLTRLLGTERSSGVQVAGLLVGFAGVAMLVGLDVSHLSAVPLLELAGAAVGYAAAPLIMTRGLADLPSIPVVSAALLVVAVAYTPYAALHPPRGLSGSQIGAVAVLAVVCTAVAFVLFFALIADIGPSRAMVITYVNPAVALLAGVLFLDEPLTRGMVIGFPLILGGSVLAARRAPTGTAAGETAREAVVPESAAAAPGG